MPCSKTADREEYSGELGAEEFGSEKRKLSRRFQHDWQDQPIRNIRFIAARVSIYTFTQVREAADRSMASSTRCTATAASRSLGSGSLRPSAPRKSPSMAIKGCS